MIERYLIVGLGNYKYPTTRHNAGMMAVNHFMNAANLPWEKFEKSGGFIQKILFNKKFVDSFLKQNDLPKSNKYRQSISSFLREEKKLDFKNKEKLSNIEIATDPMEMKNDIQVKNEVLENDNSGLPSSKHKPFNEKFLIFLKPTQFMNFSGVSTLKSGLSKIKKKLKK
ncbi:hypothetical protein HK099_003247 [Clydaea vesicula]|uniref:peptidyl-tRNA hydrolase n=1 Tax=Clydaea vesicula TaxID=447962 RepID=A0AAD5TSR5_9FUNG|nr:hypothetical protein HK099_003247 [Clydaea vesicula]